MSISLLLCVFLSAALIADAMPKRTLSPDDVVRDYGRVHYAKTTLLANHQRVLQGLEPGLFFTIDAFKRIFDFRLYPEKGVFSPTHKLQYARGPEHKVSTSHFYTGSVYSKPGSIVHLSVLNGQIEGYIVIPGKTTYYIEPMNRLFPGASDDPIMYDRARVSRPSGQRNTGEQLQCGTKEFLESPYDSYPPNNSSYEGNDVASTEQETVDSEAANDIPYVCHLHVFVDPTLWMHFKFNKYPVILTDDEINDEIVKFLASHISMLKVIFGQTLIQTYDELKSRGGVDFVIDRTTVMTEASEMCRTYTETPFCRTDLTQEEMTNLVRNFTDEEYCLGLFLTYRDFEGILGAALLPGRLGAGACGRCRNDSDFQHPSRCPGNVAWISILDQDRVLPQSVSHIALAHQVGHSFGFPHDSGPNCDPGKDSPGGNYLMHGGSFFGGGYHRDEFSPCSKDNMALFLDAVVRGCRKRKESNGTLIEPRPIRQNFSVGKPVKRWKPALPEKQEEPYNPAPLLKNNIIVLVFAVIGLIAAVTAFVLAVVEGHCSLPCRQAGPGQVQRGNENGFIREIREENGIHGFIMETSV